MKVGLHAQESIEEIIARKQKEYDQAGMIFWGYGGGTCHPRSMVQPFVREQEREGNQVLLIMNKMDSQHDAVPELAQQYSDDGVNWQPVPQGIEVRGSRFAMVLDKLSFDEFDINLDDFEVGVGPSRGRRADNYIMGRADKGCLIYTPTDAAAAPGQRIIKAIEIVARVKEPYAVFLKN